MHYNDPHVPTLGAELTGVPNLSSVPLSAEKVASYDLVLLATDHAQFDFAMIEEHARIIVDTRGVFSGARHNVVRA